MKIAFGNLELAQLIISRQSFRMCQTCAAILDGKLLNDVALNIYVVFLGTLKLLGKKYFRFPLNSEKCFHEKSSSAQTFLGF